MPVSNCLLIVTTLLTNNNNKIRNGFRVHYYVARQASQQFDDCWIVFSPLLLNHRHIQRSNKSPYLDWSAYIITTFAYSSSTYISMNFSTFPWIFPSFQDLFYFSMNFSTFPWTFPSFHELFHPSPNSYLNSRKLFSLKLNLLFNDPISASLWHSFVYKHNVVVFRSTWCLQRDVAVFLPWVLQFLWGQHLEVLADATASHTWLDDIIHVT